MCSTHLSILELYVYINVACIGCVYDYKSHGQHAKALFRVLLGIFYGTFFSKISLNPSKIV